MENDNSTREEQRDHMKIADFFMTAMFKPKSYKILLDQKIGKLIQYLLVFILLVSLVQYAIPVAGAIAGMGGVESIIMNEIPQFTLKDGVLEVNEKIEQTDEEMKIYVLVDTSVDKFTKDDIPRDMLQVLLVSKSNMLIYNNMQAMNGIIQEDKFENYKGIQLDNKTMVNLKPLIYIILFFSFLLACTMTLAKYMFMALFFAGMAFVFVKGLTLELSFGKVYILALYAQSLGVLVEAVSTCIANPLLMMGGMIFNMFATVFIMNRVLFLLKMKEGKID